jgi:hypothetical protein
MKRPALMMLATLLAALLSAACLVRPAQAAPVAASTGVPEPAPTPAGLVTQDPTALRAAPRQSAPLLTPLWRGEALELRGERGDYWQVWDPYRERGGFVLKQQVLRVDNLSANDLLAMLTLVRDTPGAEGLGLGLATAAIEAAPAPWLGGPAGAATLDALGRMAQRLADRATAGAAGRPQEQAALSAGLDVAARYGVRIVSLEIDGRMRLCYDGDAFLRLLAMQAASREQKAAAALALTREDCRDPGLAPHAHEGLVAAQAELLAQVGSDGLAPVWKNRLALRDAALHSELAFLRQRRGEVAPASLAAAQALADQARVTKTDLEDEDLQHWNETALRVNAVRWAVVPVTPPSGAGLSVKTTRQADGQTCVELLDSRQPSAAPLVRRCTWGLVWSASASVSPEGRALALAVQPADGWRELWIFRLEGTQWTLDVLPPAAAEPGLGCAEFAGWVPGGKQLLVAREAIAEGRSLRRFELLRLDTLGVDREAFDPAALGAFERWGDPQWRRASLALR